MRLPTARFLGFALPLFLLLSTVVGAQSGPDNDPAAAQGYVDNTFHDSSFDSINEFNGQLTVPISLGPEYPVGPSLKLQLMLTYNSKVWDYGAPVPPDTVGNWRPIVGDPALGIGWNFTPGKIQQPCGMSLVRACFVRSDGAEIVFFPKTPVGGVNYWETQDGNPYRLSRVGSAGAYTMSDGDGLTYTFNQQVTNYDDIRTVSPGYTRDYGRGRDGWYLTEIRDLFNNRIGIEYWSGASSCPTQCMDCSGINSWIPRYFKVQPNGQAEDLVAEVLFGAPQAGLINGFRFKVRQGLAEVWVDWNLVYLDFTYSRTGFSGCSPIGLKTLYRVQLPTDIAGLATGERAQYEFSYWQNQGLAFDGLLKTLKLPTGADVRYDYGNYHFFSARRASFPSSDCLAERPPAGELLRRSRIITNDAGGFAAPPAAPASDPCLPGSSRLSSQIQSGVVQRTVSGASLPTATTNYTQYSAPHGQLGGTDTDVQQTMTVVLLPPDVDGRRRGRVTLFYASEGSPDDESLPGGRMGDEIWIGTYDGDPNHGGVLSNSLPPSPLCSGFPPYPSQLCVKNAIRVVQHESAFSPFRHVSGQTTYYEPVTSDDPYASSYCPTCKQHSADFTPEVSWESNGRHYTFETHSGNLGNDARTIETTWDPRSDPNWLRNLYKRKQESLPSAPPGSPLGTRIKIDHSFSFSINGFLDATWSWDQPTDRILADCRYAESSGNGNLQYRVTVTNVSTTYQSQPPSSSPCFGDINSWGGTIGLNNDVFGESHGYSRGLLASRFWLRNTSSIGWFSERSDRHPATGWITTSYDTAGVTTGMTYDGIGRPVGLSPSGEAATTITYDSPLKTTASRSGDGNTWQRYVYDGLGRLSREIRQMPSAYAVRVREYDAAGNTSFQSEWGACVNADTDCLTVRLSGTTTSDFDPFGRARLVVRTNASRTTASFADGGSTYSDNLKTVNVENVGGSCSGASCSGGVIATTVSRSDAFGRVIRVTEPAAPAADVTDYIYDVAGKLVKVTQGAQARTFLYDSFGFPLTQSTPEAGAVDFQTTSQGISYSDVGSLGNVRSRKDGGTVTQALIYDPAGRLKTQAANGATYVTNCWDGDATTPCVSAGGTYRSGKLTQRIGANPGKPSTITDTFTYSGVGGRLSRKDSSATNTPSGGTLTAVQDWTYNTLGLPSSHTHPRVGADPVVTETYTYSQGYPTLLQAGALQVVKSTSYSPSGALTQWKAGNDVVTSINQDSSGIPRPASISTSGTTGGTFISGAYVYDGGGNIKSIDIDSFTYDARSRVSTAYGKTYAYDRWGNLNPTNRVDAATNRLTPSLGSYDSRGNLVSGGGQSYSYDALSRQTKAGGERYLYDGSGERIARVTGGQQFYTLTPCRVKDTRDPPGIPLNPATPLIVQMTGVCAIPAGAASVAGNLTAVTPPNVGVLTLSAADESPAASTLSYKTGVTRANNFVIGLSSTGQFRLASTSSLHAIIDVSGYFMSPTNLESWTLTFREAGNRISSEYLGASRQKDYFYLGNLLVATRSGAGAYLYYASDHLGTPRLVTDANHAKVEDHRYDAFGIELTSTFGNQPLKFAAMERDTLSKNDYDHARYQSSDLGRFLTPDKIGGRTLDPQTWNRYSYGANNPLTFVDPNGRFVVPAVVLSRVATGVAAGMFVRLAVNYGIRETADPNYPLSTGMAGAALSGAIGGVAAPEAVLGRLLVSGLGSAAGAFLNAAVEGRPIDEAMKEAERGFYRGLATGILGTAFGPSGRLGLRGENFFGLGRAAVSGMTASAGAALAGSESLSEELFLTLRKSDPTSPLKEGFQFVDGRLILVLPPGN
jgi:RHS repeat-associated protein